MPESEIIIQHRTIVHTSNHGLNRRELGDIWGYLRMLGYLENLKFEEYGPEHIFDLCISRDSGDQTLIKGIPFSKPLESREYVEVITPSIRGGTTHYHIGEIEEVRVIGLEDRIPIISTKLGKDDLEYIKEFYESLR